MYNVHFTKVTEIRMGSPYNIAEVILQGDYVPDFGKLEFQDKFAISLDATKCILVQWAHERNEPCFILWCINEKTKSMTKTKKFYWCCNGLQIVENRVLVQIWAWDSKNRISRITNEELQVFEACSVFG